MAFDAPPEFELQCCFIFLFLTPRVCKVGFSSIGYMIGRYAEVSTQVVTATQEFVKGRGLNKRQWQEFVMGSGINNI